MNCTKCKAPIPDGKLFCPQCGNLNEPSGVQSKLLQPTIKLGKQNRFIILGGMLVIISSFFPWPGLTYGYQTGLKVFPLELMNWLSFVYFVIAGDGKSGASWSYYLSSFYWAGGCVVPIAGGIAAYFAYANNAKMRGASILTGCIALILLFRHGANFFPGKFVLLAGLIALVISLFMNASAESPKA